MDNEKKQNKKTEKLKNGALKVLHIICYILSAIFILSLALSGLQSCKSTERVSAEEPTEIHNLAYTQWLLNEELDSISLDEQDLQYTISFRVGSGTSFNIISIDNGTLSYRYNPTAEPYYAYTDGFGWDGESGRMLNFYGDTTYTNYDNENIINFLKLNGVLTNPLKQFTFSANYNYNAPLGLNVGITGLPFLNDLAWVNTSDIVAPSTAIETTAVLYLPPFYSNSVLYNAIQSTFTITRSNNVVFTIDNEEKVSQVNTGLPVYTAMAFAYYSDLDSAVPTYRDVVNIRNTSQADYNGTQVLVYEEGTTWINDSYRVLNFGGYVLTGNLTTQLKSFNNSSTMIVYTDNDTDNVFGLFGNVFTSIAPVLNIRILPNMTIGMLICIPLVVAVVLFIVHMLKK